MNYDAEVFISVILTQICVHVFDVMEIKKLKASVLLGMLSNNHINVSPIGEVLKLTPLNNCTK